MGNMVLFLVVVSYWIVLEDVLLVGGLEDVFFSKDWE